MSQGAKLEAMHKAEAHRQTAKAQGPKTMKTRKLSHLSGDLLYGWAERASGCALGRQTRTVEVLFKYKNTLQTAEAHR